MPGGNLEQEILRAQGKGQLLPQPPIPMPPGVSLKVLDAIARGISYTGNPVVDQYLAQTWPQIEVPRRSIHADTTYQSAPVLYPPDTAPTDPENGATAGPTAPASEPPKPVFITDTPSTYTTTLSLTGTSSDVKYVFYIPPESIEISIPSRVGTYQSIGGGSYFDHLGEGIATISISGHTGFRRGIGKPEGSLTMGYAQYVLLKDIISKYNDECVMGNADKINLRLSISLPDSPAFGQWDVVVKDLNLKRNTQSVLLFRYSLTLLCVSKNRMEIARPAQAITRQAPDPPVYVAKPDQVKVAPAQAGPTKSAGSGGDNGEAATKTEADAKAAAASADADAAKTPSRVHVPSQIWQYKVPPLTGLKTSFYADASSNRTIINRSTGTIDFIGSATGNKVYDFFQGTKDIRHNLSYLVSENSVKKLYCVVPIVVNPEIINKLNKNSLMMATVSSWIAAQSSNVETFEHDFNLQTIEILDKLSVAGGQTKTYLRPLTALQDKYLYDKNYVSPGSVLALNSLYRHNTLCVMNPKQYHTENSIFLRLTFIISDRLYNNDTYFSEAWSTFGFAVVLTYWNNVKENPEIPVFPLMYNVPNSTKRYLIRRSQNVSQRITPANTAMYNVFTNSNTNFALPSLTDWKKFYISNIDARLTPNNIDLWATTISIATGNFNDLSVYYTNNGIVEQRKDSGYSHQNAVFLSYNNFDGSDLQITTSKLSSACPKNYADNKSFIFSTSDVHLELENRNYIEPTWELNTKLFDPISMVDQTENIVLDNLILFPDQLSDFSPKYSMGLTQGDINFAPPQNMVELVNDFYGVNYNDSKLYNADGINTVYSAIVSAIIDENQGKSNLFLNREQIWPEGTIINLPNMIDGIDYNIDSSRLGAVLGKNSGGYFTTKAYTVSSGDASAGSDY